MFHEDVWAQELNRAEVLSICETRHCENSCEDMLAAFWKYAAMQDISWSAALHKDAHMRYHQDVMFYRD